MLRAYAQNSGKMSILYLQGQIVNGETDTLRTAVESLFAGGVIILDFSRVSRIDAHGLGVLLALREQAEANAIDFKLTRVPKLVQQVLQMTRLDAVFEIASAEEVPSPVSRQSVQEEAEALLSV
jgi:anti-anti-sigma factor